MNSINIIGRMTKDPELAFIPGSGTAACSFDIAVNDYVSKKQVTYFLTVKRFGKVAENTANYCKKGSEVGITGKLTQRTYTNKENKKVNIVEIVANEVKFIGGKSNSEAPGKTNYEDTPFGEGMTPDSNINAPW